MLCQEKCLRSVTLAKIRDVTFLSLSYATRYSEKGGCSEVLEVCVHVRVLMCIFFHCTFLLVFYVLLAT